MYDFSKIAFMMDSICIYRNILKDPVMKKLHKLINLSSKINNLSYKHKIISLYCEICNILFNSESEGNLTTYISNLIKYDDNKFSRACAKGLKIDENILNISNTDIKNLLTISNLDSHTIKNILSKKMFKEDKNILNDLPNYVITDKSSLDIDYVKFYKNQGVGIFAKYNGFLFDGKIKPIKNLDKILISDLKQYKSQQDKVINNTVSFLSSKPANNVLLYGDRGTGKSSTIKAILNEYSHKGLRMIEVKKQSLLNLDKLMFMLQEIPLKFIVFIDDLSFNENDDRFCVLKALLEGSLASKPKNVLIYATSNRRHLVKENFSSREGNEVHIADTIDENLSLYDRFGLTVTFIKPNKDDFLEIVRLIAIDKCLDVKNEKLFSEAEKFALSKGVRSPRIARQFINYICSTN